MKTSTFPLEDILQEKFGFTSFRPGQKEAIETLLTHGKLLCILPTGHGKSLLYQLPTCLLEGITIVISPLLALMRDQINHLNKRFNIPAAAINTDQTDEENDLARAMAIQGQIKVLFVAPEQLDHVDRFDFLLKLNPSLIVVDEAHCISTWGHDFRPSYRQIVHYLRAVHQQNPHVKVLGITATANQRVEKDIKQQLKIDDEEIELLRESMDRPNLSLEVVEAKGVARKLAACADILKKLNGCGLVYCATRENTELVAEYLAIQGVNATFYHAGCEQVDKRRLQEEFSVGQYKAVVATNALGMGIDKADLRFIIHFDMPGSITAYYQEVGRAGRDGLPAHGILLFDPADKQVHEYFIQSALPGKKDFNAILKAIDESPEPPNLTGIKRVTGLHPTRVTIVLAELVEQGFVRKFSLSGKQVYGVVRNKSTAPDLSRYANQLEAKTQELKAILQFGEENSQCRMSILRFALGDSEVQPCGHCDRCGGKKFHLQLSEEAITEASQWLANRPVPIAPTVKVKLSAGIAVLNGTYRSGPFLTFMRQRAQGIISEEWLTLFCQHAKKLTKEHPIVGIIPLPSRTWPGRDVVAEILGKQLGVPVLKNMLIWEQTPVKRQGELYNNDQRQENVEGRMHCSLKDRNLKGAFLLLDDYVGSGNTLKEAARAFRARNGSGDILIPLTVAAVKWHLGKIGFV